MFFEKKYKEESGFASQRKSQKWFSVCEAKNMTMHCLKSGNAQVMVSSIGGQVISWRIDGQEIIYPQRTVGTKKRGGIPICFPFFGPPKPRFVGIPQHGWLRDEELEAVHERKDYIRFQGFSQKRAGYPWALKYWVNIYLTPGGLEVTLRVERLQDGIKEDAPIDPAFHTYFAFLGKSAIKIGRTEIEDFTKDETIHIGEKRTPIIDLGKKKIKMLLSSHFGKKTCITLWTDNSKEYFCVEPSLTHPDEFDTPKGKYLQQGETLILRCTLKTMN